jgi:hypothetical protein
MTMPRARMHGSALIMSALLIGGMVFDLAPTIPVVMKIR